MNTITDERVIHFEVTVPANLSRVWQAWTTSEGVTSFFAPACHIELHPGGPYEMYFDLEAEPGLRGGEGNRILSIQPEKMLSFTWNAPPELANVRPQRTHVVVRFYALENELTRLTLTHDGWGEGKEWQQAFDYFMRAWSKVVLPRLVHRFTHGPLDWSNPPQVG